MEDRRVPDRSCLNLKHLYLEELRRFLASEKPRAWPRGIQWIIDYTEAHPVGVHRPDGHRTWLWSDLHLRHANIIKHCKRPSSMPNGLPSKPVAAPPARSPSAEHASQFPSRATPKCSSILGCCILPAERAPRRRASCGVVPRGCRARVTPRRNSTSGSCDGRLRTAPTRAATQPGSLDVPGLVALRTGFRVAERTPLGWGPWLDRKAARYSSLVKWGQPQGRRPPVL